MELAPLMLARIQFALNVSFHILFPAVTIALGWVLLWFKLRYNKTGDTAYMEAYFFLGQDFRSFLCHGHCLWHYHVFPVRDELARLYGNGR